MEKENISISDEAEVIFKPDHSKDTVKVARTNDGKLELTIKDITLFLPNDDTMLIDNFSVSLKSGDRLVLTGASGSGKSTVVRAIRNIWPKGSGDVSLPAEARILCLSQKTHLPRTDLRGILSSPLSKEEANFTDEEIDQALTDVGLEDLRKQLAGNQTKREFLYQKIKPYFAKAVDHWRDFIVSLPERQRELLCIHINKRIRQDAENFFPDRIKAHMTDEKKAKFADKVTGELKTLMADIPIKRPFFDVFMNFDHMLAARQKNFADQIAKYILQATATEVAIASKDGGQLSRQLSGGQQQLLLFAQVLLHKPNILIMDEATSALDPKSTEKMYKLILDRLPDSIIIGIAHNTSVIVYHTLHGHLENKKVEVKKIEETKRPSSPAPV